MRIALFILVLAFSPLLSALAKPDVRFPSAPYVRVNEFVPVEISLGQKLRSFDIESPDGLIIRVEDGRTSFKTAIFNKAGSTGFAIVIGEERFEYEWPKQVVPRSNKDFLVAISRDSSIRRDADTVPSVRTVEFENFYGWPPRALGCFDGVVIGPYAPKDTTIVSLRNAGVGAFIEKRFAEFYPESLSENSGIERASELLELLKAARFADVPANLPHYYPTPPSTPLPDPPLIAKEAAEGSMGFFDIDAMRFFLIVVVASIIAIAKVGERKKRMAILGGLAGISVIGATILPFAIASHKENRSGSAESEATIAPIWRVSFTRSDGRGFGLSDGLAFYETPKHAHNDSRIGIYDNDDFFVVYRQPKSGSVIATLDGEDSHLSLPAGSGVMNYSFGDPSLPKGSYWQTSVLDGSPFMIRNGKSIALNDFPSEIEGADANSRFLIEFWLKRLFVVGRSWEVGLDVEKKQISFRFYPNGFDNTSATR